MQVLFSCQINKLHLVARFVLVLGQKSHFAMLQHCSEKIGGKNSFSLFHLSFPDLLARYVCCVFPSLSFHLPYSIYRSHAAMTMVMPTNMPGRQVTDTEKNDITGEFFPVLVSPHDIIHRGRVTVRQTHTWKLSWRTCPTWLVYYYHHQHTRGKKSQKRRWIPLPGGN